MSKIKKYSNVLFAVILLFAVGATLIFDEGKKVYAANETVTYSVSYGGEDIYYNPGDYVSIKTEMVKDGKYFQNWSYGTNKPVIDGKQIISSDGTEYAYLSFIMPDKNISVATNYGNTWKATINKDGTSQEVSYTSDSPLSIDASGYSSYVKYEVSDTDYSYANGITLSHGGNVYIDLVSKTDPQYSVNATNNYSAGQTVAINKVYEDSGNYITKISAKTDSGTDVETSSIKRYLVLGSSSSSGTDGSGYQIYINATFTMPDSNVTTSDTTQPGCNITVVKDNGTQIDSAVYVKGYDVPVFSVPSTIGTTALDESKIKATDEDGKAVSIDSISSSGGVTTIKVTPSTQSSITITVPYSVSISATVESLTESGETGTTETTGSTSSNYDPSKYDYKLKSKGNLIYKDANGDVKIAIYTADLQNIQQAAGNIYWKYENGVIYCKNGASGSWIPVSSKTSSNK